jgi:peptide/nickel transport system permease protein
MASPAQTSALPASKGRRRTNFVPEILKRVWRTPEGKIGVVLFIILLFLAIAGPWITPYDPVKVVMKERFQAPNSAHWFGTDEVGRDVLSRVIDGTRITLLAALTVIALAAAVGIPLGMLAGFYGRWADTVIMRITDMFLGFPAMLLAIAVAGALGPGLTKGMIASALVWWPGYARLARGQVLSIKEFPFVEAARAVGVPDSKILFQHILANATSPFIIKFTMDIGYAIIFISGLGFLGLGAQPPQPEWGTMIADGRTYIMDQWWYAMFPGLAISGAVVCFNFLGDALQYALDPTLSRLKRS